MMIKARGGAKQTQPQGGRASTTTTTTTPHAAADSPNKTRSYRNVFSPPRRFLIQACFAAIVLTTTTTTITTPPLVILDDDNNNNNNNNNTDVSLSPLPSPRDMFVALSDMLPGHRGTCPDLLPDYPAEVLQIAEMFLCANVIQKDAASNECIMYNFGVGKTDKFLTTMGRNPRYKNCTIYAFDPFVSVEEAPKFGSNIHFYPIGLWNGYSERKVGKDKSGTLMSLKEIQDMLHHDSTTRITFFRSDCEGCEYGWVQHAMNEDPTIFERIGQMFIEIHTVPVHGMPALPLPWSASGEPPADLLEPLYVMMTKYFRVLDAEMNPGYPADRNRVPKELEHAGVVPYPCCRELHLIGKSLVATVGSITTLEGDKDDTSGDGCNKDALKTTVPPTSFEHLEDSFANLFQGRRNKCPDGAAPRTLQQTQEAFCPDSLFRRKTCVIYFFGDFAVDTDSLDLLSTDYPRCVIYAFDPAWNASFWDTTNTTTNTSTSINTRPNIRFFPWGLYPGHGPRHVTTTVVQQQQQQQAMGQLFTLKEIARSWTGKDFPHFDGDAPPPTRIDLVRVDWKRTPLCVWQRELSKPFTTWWGTYLGTGSIVQAM